MFWKSKSRPHAITSIIGEDLTVHGDVHFRGGLQINGAVNGNVSARTEDGTRSHMSLHSKGRVNGNISAPFLVLDGEVEGNVSCQKFLVIDKHCRITGDVHYLSMNMAPGAVVSGRIRHVPEGLMIEHKDGAPVAGTAAKSTANS